MSDFLEICLTGPRLPATILLGLVCLYWLIVIVGAIDFDLFDLDLDADVDVNSPGSLSDLGMVSLKFMNLGQVPLMLWMSVFSFSAWVLTVEIDGDVSDVPWTTAAGILLRNGAIALAITKLVTQPLRGKFINREPNKPGELLGKTCIIHIETSDKHGQAEYLTDAAPLYLNVRTSGDVLPKGTAARLVDYDPEKNIYLVESDTR
jgi:hypothetical protein